MVSDFADCPAELRLLHRVTRDPRREPHIVRVVHGRGTVGWPA